MIAVLLAAGVAVTEPAAVLHEEALRLLQSGNARGAEEKVTEAIARSQRFVPEEEIGARPERGLLFEEMILAARKSYRARRAQYFRTLGDALAAQEKWAPSRKAYRRALEITDIPGLLLQMAHQPDLKLQQKLDLLLGAYLAGGSDRTALERELLETGVFLDRNALKASLDRKRFKKLQESYPDLELLDGTFPDFQAATDGGTLIPSELFRMGTTLIVYSPVDGCARCSEELDGLTLPIRSAQKSHVPLEVAAFVPEKDLEGARRIARLLSIPVKVARKDFVPRSIRFLPEGEIRIVARGGMTQIRIPMAEDRAAAEIRQRAEAAFSFLEEPGLPTEARPEDASARIVSLARPDRNSDDRRSFLSWVETVEKLELGPAPLDDFYAELNRLAQHVVPADHPDALALLKALSRLRGAHAAKARFLGLAAERAGEKLLSKAKELDSTVSRTPAGEEGTFLLAVADDRVYLQRSFEAEGGLRDFDFVLADEPGSPGVVWGALQENTPLGIEPVESGGAFLFGCRERCPGARLWSEGKVVFEGGPATVVGSELVELRSAIVDPPPRSGAGPLFHHSTAGRPETLLEKGLRLFQSGDFVAAGLAFEQAQKAIDPVAPYDASDLTYDRARALQEQGKRREALALFRSLGDVSYQSLVDEKARLIESGR